MPVLGIPSETVSTVVLCVAVFCGAVLCFFGYRLFRFAVALAGLALGAAAAAYIVWHQTAASETLAAVVTLHDVIDAVLHPWNPEVILVWAVAGGIAGAVLSAFLQHVGVFALGSLLGGVIVSYAMAGSPTKIYWITLAVVGLVGGVLALLLRKLIIVISTAVNGSLALIFRLFALAGGHSCEEAFERLRVLGGSAYVVFGCTIVLAAVGGYVQFITMPEAKPKDGSKKDAGGKKKK